MPLVALDGLAPLIGTRRRLAGLDVGTKTIGLAIADGLGISAAPVATLRRTKFSVDLQALQRFIAERAVGGLVIGLPVNMDGSEGPRCQSVRQFAANLDERGLDLPMALWDERLSTAAVERLMIEADYSRAKRARLVDGMAAAWILQGALDRLRAARTADARTPDS